MPGRRSAPSTARAAKPTPPAAPAPSASASSSTSRAEGGGEQVRVAGRGRRRGSRRRSGVAPFCGPKTAAAPLRTEQGIGDVGGQHEPGCRPGVGRGRSRSTTIQLAQTAATGLHRVAAAPSSSRAPRALSRPAPPSVFGAAADPEHDLAAAGVQRGPDQLLRCRSSRLAGRPGAVARPRRAGGHPDRTRRPSRSRRRRPGSAIVAAHRVAQRPGHRRP